MCSDKSKQQKKWEPKIERLEQALQAESEMPSLVNMQDENGMTPLMRAFRNKQFDVASALLKQKGIDIHIKDKAGHTALYYAVESGHQPFVRQLIDKGLDVHETGVIGETLLHCAVRGDNLDLVRYLCKDHQLDVNAFAVGYGTPLFYATAQDKLDIARYFITAGADVSGKYDYTPLRAALRNNRLDFARELLKHENIDVLQQDSSGKSDIDYCDDEALKQLIREKASRQKPKKKKMPSRLQRIANSGGLTSTLHHAQKDTSESIDVSFEQRLAMSDKTK